jgi:hypothetical protein
MSSACRALLCPASDEKCVPLLGVRFPEILFLSVIDSILNLSEPVSCGDLTNRSNNCSLFMD